MAHCAFCQTWLSNDYARVNGGKGGRVLCTDCDGVVSEHKPEAVLQKNPGAIPELEVEAPWETRITEREYEQ